VPGVSAFPFRRRKRFRLAEFAGRCWIASPLNVLGGRDLNGGRHAGDERNIIGILVEVDADGDALRKPHPREYRVHFRKP